LRLEPPAGTVKAILYPLSAGIAEGLAGYMMPHEDLVNLNIEAICPMFHEGGCPQTWHKAGTREAESAEYTLDQVPALPFMMGCIIKPNCGSGEGETNRRFFTLQKDADDLIAFNIDSENAVIKAEREIAGVSEEIEVTGSAWQREDVLRFALLESIEGGQFWLNNYVDSNLASINISDMVNIEFDWLNGLIAHPFILLQATEQDAEDYLNCEPDEVHILVRQWELQGRLLFYYIPEITSDHVETDAISINPVETHINQGFTYISDGDQTVSSIRAYTSPSVLKSDGVSRAIIHVDCTDNMGNPVYIQEQNINASVDYGTVSLSNTHLNRYTFIYTAPDTHPVEEESIITFTYDSSITTEVSIKLRGE